jgi:hypothetical protein
LDLCSQKFRLPLSLYFSCSFTPYLYCFTVHFKSLNVI